MPPRLPQHLAVAACLLLGCGSDTYEGELTVHDRDDVARVAGLSSVVGAVVVDGDHGAKTIAWPKLTTVTDRLVIRDQAALEVLDLSGLTAVGTLIIERNPQLATIRLPNLRSVGWLVITGCKSTSLELPALTQVDSLTISNARLETLALPVLQRLGAGPSPPSLIKDNVLLTSLELPALRTIEAGATLMIERNPSLTTLAMPTLTTLAGGLTIMNNPALHTVRLDVLAHVAAAVPFFIRASPALTRLHVPALDSPEERLNVDFVASPWGDRPLRRLPRGDLRQAAVNASGVVLLGYAASEAAVFEARERDGELRWHTTVTDQRAHRSILWTAPTFVSPSTSAAYFMVNIDSRAQDDTRLHEVVGLALDTGAVSWREPGTRSWAADGFTLVLRPRVDGMWDEFARLVALSDARLTDPTNAEVRVGDDDHAAVHDVLDAGERRFVLTRDERYNVISLDATGVTGRVTSLIQDTVLDDSGRVVIVCDPAAAERSRFEYHVAPDHVLACPDPSAEDTQIPADLHAIAKPFLHLAPKAMPYLALTDGRSTPRPLRLGPAVIAPLDPRVVPLALVGDRLVLAVPRPDRQADVYALTLGDAPTITRVEGLAGTAYNESSQWDFLPTKPLGAHLPLVFRHDGTARLHLVDLTTARVDLTLPITQGGDFLYGRPRTASTDGLLGFDLPLDFIGNAMVWVEARDPRPAVVTAYQLRDERGVVVHEVSAAPRQDWFFRAPNAFGAGLHVASVAREKGVAAVIIDIRQRRIVWSDVDDLRLVDLTDIVAERWAQAWAR